MKWNLSKQLAFFFCCKKEAIHNKKTSLHLLQTRLFYSIKIQLPFFRPQQEG